MAVTRDGIPVRVWSWPGSTGDTDLIRQVRDDIREWTLSRVIWVADRGFTSAEEPPGPDARRRRVHHRGEAPLRLRGGQGRPVPAGPLRHRQGQHAGQGSQHRHRRPVRALLQPRPGRTRRRSIRAQLVAQLEEVITGTDTLTTAERARIEGTLSGKPGLKRFLRVTPGGLLRVDKQKIKTEANLDGKYLLRCSDPHLSAEDIALGYKQLLEVERGWRDMKQILDLRPVYHRREDRIRAHVLLCWLALLLIRVAETTAGDPGPGTGSAPSSSACTPSPAPARPAPSARPPS